MGCKCMIAIVVKLQVKTRYEEQEWISPRSSVYFFQVPIHQSEKRGRFPRDLVGAAIMIWAEIGAGLRNLGAEMGKRWEMGCPWDNYPIWGQELGCTGSLSIPIWGRTLSAPKILSSSLPHFADWPIQSFKLNDYPTQHNQT